MSVKLLSLNIESHNHLDRIIPFCQHYHPDIIHFQEVFEADMPLLEKELGMSGFFSPMAMVDKESIHQKQALGVWGVAQLSRWPVLSQQTDWYVGTKHQLPIFFENENPNSMNRVLSWMVIETPEGNYTLATTHFTWSAKGSYTEEQAQALHSLKQKLDQFPEFVLTGDFNSPRNMKEGKLPNAYHQLAQHYHDWIPQHYTTSIDGEFHKAGQLDFMVDGLFSTPQYQCSNVVLQRGLSDHQAILAEVARRPL